MLIALIIIASVMFILCLIALITTPGSVYRHKPEERNPMEGKMVRFIENESEKENADGVRGHLAAIGESNHKASVY